MVTTTTKPVRRAGRAYPRSIWGLWIAIPILVVSCILELGLKITAPRLGSFDVPRDASVLVPGDRLVASAMRLWPAAVQKGEVMVPTVLAAVTLVEVLALGFFVVRVVRQNPVTIPLTGRITMLLAMAIIDIFGIATLGFVFIVNYKSARFDNAQALTQAEAARLASGNPNAGFGSAEFTYQGSGPLPRRRGPAASRSCRASMRASPAGSPGRAAWSRRRGIC
ncbi:unnamed protein product [Parascedosporium putredinis]|uniref:Uncharacterized protein n=1 Tax=Parascedosporium putredinis TaxID=1442378 RepID=A0A9P1M8T4_9PEZI|nr:unnamed protein product [Parascedosporium putredinis]CAI7993365.1 unnamed protein product [Parascedosporium putredinis]